MCKMKGATVVEVQPFTVRLPTDTMVCMYARFFSLSLSKRQNVMCLVIKRHAALMEAQERDTWSIEMGRWCNRGDLDAGHVTLGETSRS